MTGPSVGNRRERTDPREKEKIHFAALGEKRERESMITLRLLTWTIRRIFA